MLCWWIGWWQTSWFAKYYRPLCSTIINRLNFLLYQINGIRYLQEKYVYEELREIVFENNRYAFPFSLPQSCRNLAA